jgi:hypothetical protein
MLPIDSPLVMAGLLSKVTFKIRFLKVTGEKLSKDLTGLEPFLIRFSQIITDMGHIPDQIYNADESGIYSNSSLVRVWY